jgi:oligopeptide/dipeptide ABC transporter ATP-binding protein
LNQNETLGLAGESGSGKSVTCLSILRLNQSAGCTVSGKILFEGEDLLIKKEGEMRHWRGKKIAMILQDPLMSLNPVYTIGDQVTESFRLDDRNMKYSILRNKAIDVLKSVNIPSAEQRLNSYPWEFSGGMRQRTVAAIAISRLPRLLIADEPTTSLDVTVQDQFLKLLKQIQQRTGMCILLVTHDLGIVAESCDRVAIMYGGKIVETGTVERVFEKPVHPYTQALMKAIPKLGNRTERMFQIDGEPPNPANLPTGCCFHPRCSKVMDICRTEYPPRIATNNRDRDYVACWLVKNGGA